MPMHLNELFQRLRLRLHIKLDQMYEGEKDDNEKEYVHMHAMLLECTTVPHLFKFMREMAYDFPGAVSETLQAACIDANEDDFDGIPEARTWDT